MGCLVCKKTEKIPVCTTDLVLGKIADIDTDVDIYVRNITTDRLYVFDEDANGAQIKSDGTGLVTLPMSVRDIWMPDHFYECWIVKTSATGIEDRMVITIGDDTPDCLNLNFERVNDADSGQENYSSITVALSN